MSSDQEQICCIAVGHGKKTNFDETMLLEITLRLLASTQCNSSCKSRNGTAGILEAGFVPILLKHRIPDRDEKT